MSLRVSGEIVRYDRRLRRTTRMSCTATLSEGLHGRFRAVDISGASVRAEVRTVEEPERCVASGVYANGAWTFEGDPQEWSMVNEYIVVETQAKQELLRISDGAEAVSIPELVAVVDVKTVPGSRLVALASRGNVTVWDPVTKRFGEHLRVGDSNSSVAMEFRPGADELWLSCASTLMALDTRHWEVVDAAGYEGDGVISHWAFVDGGSSVLVSRVGNKEILVLDATTMLPAATATMKDVPVDCIAVDGRVWAISEKSKFIGGKLESITHP